MRILLASPFLVYPDTNGAKARILAFMRVLSRAGHEVHFAYFGIDKADPSRCEPFMRDHCASFTDLRDDAYPWAEPDDDGFQIDDWLSEAQIQGFRELHDRLRPDMTIVNYIFLSGLLEGLDSVKVIDLHDRLARAEQYTAIDETPKFFFTTEARELAAVARADIVLCIQENEKPYFEAAGVPVFTFGHILPRAYLDRRFTALNTVGYLGAFNVFNNHAVKELIESFGNLVEDFPDLQLRLGGGVCNAIDDAPDFVQKVGYVPSVADFYRSVDLALNPTVAGTGLKIKTVEALAFGMPIVSTRIGMDGLAQKTDFHGAETIADLVDMIRRIKERDFKELTKLSNLSKVLHTEYTETQKRTIRSFLDFGASHAAAQAGSGPAPEAASDTTAVQIADLAPPKTEAKMLHVLNPFHAPEASDNFLAQPITFESMADAIDFARHSVKVDVLNLHMPDEAPVDHPVFTYTEPLKGGSKDLLPDYPRDLPLLRDIVDAAAAHDDYDWLIYTNVDIALTPAFYRRLLEYIEEGHDAIVINRRTISKRISGLDQLSEAYGMIGNRHPGFDCFVFRRDLVEKFELFDTLVGVHLIGRMLIWNLLRHAKSLHVEKEEHLTFHIGDDVPSKDFGEVDIIAHNFRQAAKFWTAVETEPADLERMRGVARSAAVEDALKFNVGRLVTPAVHRGETSASTSCPVHLHGHFRCGSTFLFRQLRSDKSNMCFYEPFHEDIEILSSKNIDVKKRLHTPANFHKEHDGDWFFAESEDFIREHGHVPGFRAAFGTEMFGDNGPSDEIESYVNMLVDHAYASNKRPILQFNRTGLRLRYFKRTFPDHAHFFILRDLKDQWNSYLRFMSEGRRGFLRSHIAILGRSRKSEGVGPLSELIPLYRLDSDRDLHNRYNKYFDLYSIEQLYVSFYYTWMVSLLDAVEIGVPIINTSAIERSPKVQARTDSDMMSYGMGVDWAGLSTERYDEYGFADRYRGACEALVNEKLRRAYPGDIAERLDVAGFPSEANRLNRTDGGAEDLRRAFSASLSWDGAELVPQVLEAAAKSRSAEAKRPAISRLVDEPHTLPLLTPGKNRFSVEDGDFKDVSGFMVGFAPPEKKHIWAVSRSSSFAFRLPFLAMELKVRLFLSSSEGLRDKDSDYTIDVNGQTYVFEKCGPWRRVEFDVPAPVANAGRCGSVQFTIDSKEAADMIGEARALYFAMSYVEVEFRPMQ